MNKLPADFKVEMTARQLPDGEDWTMRIFVTLRTAEDGEALRNALDTLLPLLPPARSPQESGDTQ
jgi:hypothetical protein